MILPKQAAPVQRGNSTRASLPSGSEVEPCVASPPWKFDCKKITYKDDNGDNKVVHMLRWNIKGQPPVISEWACVPDPPAGK